jgi:hypothetical protein
MDDDDDDIKRKKAVLANFNIVLYSIPEFAWRD